MKHEPAIKISGLSKKYRLQHPIKQEDGSMSHELWAFKDLDLEINQGEAIGIVGPNGSGKSTLLKILAGVSKPTMGEVEIIGKIASILDIGAGFHPELSGRENVFLNGQLLGFSKKQIQQHFDEIVDFSGIEKFIDEPVKNYSSGMYLRLAFSIMIQMEADIYLFDEVLSVGDEEFRAKSNTKIKQKILQGATSITVSHEVALLTSFVTKLISFPSLQPIHTPLSFSSITTGAHDPSNILIETLGFKEEGEQYLVNLLLQNITNTSDIDIVFLFSPTGRTGEDFAISSLHPAKLTFEPIKENNKMKFESIIPKNLINPGNYSISVQVIQHKTNVVKIFRDYINIQVNNHENPTDRFFDFYPGSIRLQTEWNIQN